MASAKCAQPQVWNSGAAMWRAPAATCSGSRDSSAVAASMPASLRGAPFGVPVVPEVRMMTRLCFSGAGWSPGEPCGDQRLERDPGRRVGRPRRSTQPSTRSRVSASSSSSVNSSSCTTTWGLLALEDVDELRAGEGGVEVEDVGAELGGGDARVDEAAVVAAHDRDAVARADAARAQRVGEPVAAVVQLAEGQLAELVDDRGPVGVAGSPSRRTRRRGRSPSAAGSRRAGRA